MSIPRYQWTCRVCDEVMETTYYYEESPRHCDEKMKRDYKAEAASATFKGGGWARGR